MNAFGATRCCLRSALWAGIGPVGGHAVIVTSWIDATRTMPGMSGGDISTFDNCWADNTFATSAPTDVESLAPCDQPVATTGWDVGTLNVALWLVEAETRPPAQPYDTAPTPEPEPQENMPDAATAPAHPATDVPFAVDLDAITVPAEPA